MPTLLRSRARRIVAVVKGLALVVAGLGGAFQPARAATWFVDSTATGADNGTSWANAWSNPEQVSGLAPGDTVYVSGGPAGTTQTYNLSAGWSALVGGIPGSPITYQIGQDPLHDGIAIFNATTPGATWFQQVSNVNVLGDAGDGNQHFKLTGYAWLAWGSGQSNIHISYVYADDLSEVANFNPVTGLEIDHCYLYISDLTSDHAIYAQIGGTTWNDSLVHDNTIYVPNSGDGTGADALQLNGSGFSIYDNWIIGYVGAYTGSQHQDGWQGTGGSSYIKIYGNYFENIANYPVFGDAYFGGFTHLWVYNNVMVLTNAALQATNPPQGIAIGPDGGSFNQLGAWPAFTDVVVCNNLVSDYGIHLAVSLHNNPGQASVFSQCLMENNVAVDSGPFGPDPAVAAANNVSLSAGQAAGTFVGYAPLGSSNDYRLAAAAQDLIGQGANLSSFFTTDKDGVARSPALPWDIGPYAYVGALPAPVLTAPLTVVATLGAFFNYGIYASNSPTSFNATNLPAGLSVNPGTGGITGVPSVAGTYAIPMSASNSGGTGTAVLSLTVVAAMPAPVITAPLTATATVGAFFNYGIYASNVPTSFGAANLPDGLSVNPGTGGITGVPSVAGTYAIPMSASNSGGTGTAVLSLTVVAAMPAPVITAPLTATATVGAFFNYGIYASNSPTSFGATNLPAGLSVNPGTGGITGVPSAAGTYAIPMSATNAGGTGAAVLVLTVL